MPVGAAEGSLSRRSPTPQSLKKNTHTHHAEDSAAVLPLPEGTSLTQCRRQQERPTILLGALSFPPAGKKERERDGERE